MGHPDQHARLAAGWLASFSGGIGYPINSNQRFLANPFSSRLCRRTENIRQRLMQGSGTEAPLSLARTARFLIEPGGDRTTCVSTVAGRTVTYVLQTINSWNFDEATPQDPMGLKLSDNNRLDRGPKMAE